MDKNISPDKKALRSLISYHAGGYTVGIHPSWQSGDEQAVLMEEVDKLAGDNRTARKIQPPALYPDEFTKNLSSAD